MTLLLFFLLIIVPGFILKRFNIGRVAGFKIFPFLIATLPAAVVYYVFPQIFFGLDFDFINTEFWEDAMALWLVQDALITACWCASVFMMLIIMLLQRSRLEITPIIKFITWFLFALCLLFVLFHELNSNSPHFSPTWWFTDY